MSTKPGQLFSIDFIIGAAIFLVAFTLLTLYWQNFNLEIRENGQKEDLTRTAYFVSEIWFSDGYPQYWNKDNVISIGLQNDNRFNWTKMVELQSLGYSKFQQILGVTLYSIHMKAYNSTTTLYEFGELPANAKDSIRVVRAGILNSSAVKVEVVVSK